MKATAKKGTLQLLHPILMGHFVCSPNIVILPKEKERSISNSIKHPFSVLVDAYLTCLTFVSCYSSVKTHQAQREQQFKLRLEERAGCHEEKPPEKPSA